MLRWITTVVVLLVGCSGDQGGPERVILSGVVTYEGKPIENGDILFSPVAGNDSPSAGAVITNGKYEVRNKGGVPLGKFVVKISAYRPRPGSGQDGEVPEVIQYVPEKYNQKSVLEVDVTRRNKDEPYDFDLE